MSGAFEVSCVDVTFGGGVGVGLDVGVEVGTNVGVLDSRTLGILLARGEGFGLGAVCVRLGAVGSTLGAEASDDP